MVSSELPLALCTVAFQIILYICILNVIHMQIPTSTCSIVSISTKISLHSALKRYEALAAVRDVVYDLPVSLKKPHIERMTR